MKISFLLPFVRSAKPFVFIRFWAPFFNQNRKKAISPLLGAEKWKLAHFPLLGRFCRQKRSRTQKLAQKWKKRFWAFWAPKTCPEPYVFHCFALGAKMMLFRLLQHFALFYYNFRDEIISSFLQITLLQFSSKSGNCSETTYFSYAGKWVYSWKD